MQRLFVRGSLLLLAALMMIGCGASASIAPTAAPPTAAPSIIAPTAAPPTAVPPTTAPTTAPPTAAPPTAAPTAAPPTAAPTAAPSSVLPAPLYFIDQQRQLARLEIDGKTITPITSEADPVFDFTVARGDGSLAYLTIAQGGQTTRLIRSDAQGQGRTELVSGILRSIAMPYTGASVEIGVLDQGRSAGGAELAPGVWSFPIGGGEPTQIAANTPPQGAGDNITPGTRYMPIAWSPDGQKLLLRTSINFGPDGPGGDIGTTGLALFDQASAEVRQLLPTSQEPLCIDASWDGQSVAIYCATSFYAGDNTPALFRLNIVRNDQETLIPLKTGDQQNLAANVRELDDGLYSMVSTAPSDASEPAFTLQRTGQDAASDRVVLSKEPLAIGFNRALWAEDGSGVVMLLPATGESRDLVWYPFGGASPVTLAGGQLGDTLGWGKS
jgi:hypothetical protein